MRDFPSCMLVLCLAGSLSTVMGCTCSVKKTLKGEEYMHVLLLLNNQMNNSQLNLNMLNPDKPCFENSVDFDQLASEKPADQNPHCFLPCL